MSIENALKGNFNSFYNAVTNYQYKETALAIWNSQRGAEARQIPGKAFEAGKYLVAKVVAFLADGGIRLSTYLPAIKEGGEKISAKALEKTDKTGFVALGVGVVAGTYLVYRIGKVAYDKLNSAEN